MWHRVVIVAIIRIISHHHHWSLSPTPHRTIHVNEEEKQELVGPQQYFVEIASYKEATNTIPPENEVVQKSYLGRLLSGVIVVGRKWHLMWEDGQAGIFQWKSTSSVAVRRSTELADTAENPHLADNMSDKITTNAVQRVISTHMDVANPIRMPTSAAGLLAAAGDDLDVDTPGTPAPARASAPAHTPALPQIGATAAGDAASTANLDEPTSFWDRFGPQRAQSAAKAKAKAKAAPKASGENKRSGKAKAKPTAQPKAGQKRSAPTQAAAEGNAAEATDKRSRQARGQVPPEADEDGTPEMGPLSDADKQWGDQTREAHSYNMPPHYATRMMT